MGGRGAMPHSVICVYARSRKHCLQRRASTQKSREMEFHAPTHTPYNFLIVIDQCAPSQPRIGFIDTRLQTNYIYFTVFLPSDRNQQQILT